MEHNSTPARQRKSTFTQQQKNKKRQRATPKQLSVLRNEFMVNSTPNARTREEIGRKIDMTERSVQIWFQNKRAKTKQFARRNTCGYPGNIAYINAVRENVYFSNPSLISPMASPHFHNGMNYTTATSSTGRYMSPYFSNANGGAGLSQLNIQSPNEIPFHCSSLTIGSWQRVVLPGSISNSLNITFSLMDSSFSYTMFASSTGFRIKFSLNDIKNIHYNKLQDSLQIAVLQVQVSKSPSFYIQTPEMGGHWIPCDDFSEMKQASQVHLHQLSGPSMSLLQQISLIAAIDHTKVTGINIPPSTSTGSINSIQNYSGMFSTVSANGSAKTEKMNNVTSRAMSVTASPIIDQLNPTVVVSNHSPEKFTQHLSVPPMKMRSRSLPENFANDEVILQESSSDDELFLVDSSVTLSEIGHEDEAGLNMWSFTSSSFYGHEDMGQTGSSKKPSDFDSLTNSTPVSPRFANENNDSPLHNETFVELNAEKEYDSLASSTSSFFSLSSTIATEISETHIIDNLLLDSELSTKDHITGVQTKQSDHFGHKEIEHTSDEDNLHEIMDSFSYDPALLSFIEA